MFFGLHRNPDLPLILLSPSDGYRLQRGYIAPEAVEAQLVRLKNDYDLTYAEWLPDEEYGIRGPGVDYHVPITARALVDLMEGPAFQLLRADLAVDWKIRNPCYVYLGAADALQLDGADAMVRLLRDRFGNHEVAVFSGGDHHLRPVTDEVIDNIAAWLHRRPAW
jgi:hypothetical protein